MSCCLWFNRKARNRSSTWFVQGFIEDQNLFRDQDCYVRNEKAQDYHDMLRCIYKEMKDIRDSGGIEMTLDFGPLLKHNVIAIPVIQFIIGDCKGNDLLCGRKGGHSLLMNGLCRDCNIHPKYADDTCIEKELRCQFITSMMHLVKQMMKSKDILSYLLRTVFMIYHLVDANAIFMELLQLNYFMLYYLGYANILQKEWICYLQKHQLI